MRRQLCIRKRGVFSLDNLANFQVLVTQFQIYLNNEHSELNALINAEYWGAEANIMVSFGDYQNSESGKKLLKLWEDYWKGVVKGLKQECEESLVSQVINFLRV